MVHSSGLDIVMKRRIGGAVGLLLCAFASPANASSSSLNEAYRVVGIQLFVGVVALGCMVAFISLAVTLGRRLRESDLDGRRRYIVIARVLAGAFFCVFLVPLGYNLLAHGGHDFEWALLITFLSGLPAFVPGGIALVRASQLANIER